MTPATHHQPIDRDAWTRKAVAFVTRSHRQLWARNNESMLAWLFENGLTNAIAKTMVLGWNKHDQKRDWKYWGLSSDLFLPAGIVVPTIINKTLKAVTIYRHERPHGSRVYCVPGGEAVSMVLGDNYATVVVVLDVIDGLYLYQQAGDHLSVIIPYYPNTSPDRIAHAALERGQNHILLAREHAEQCRWPAMDWHYRSRQIPLQRYKDKASLDSLVRQWLPGP